MSRLIVHVGLEKTGTKSLQQFLRTNAAVLRQSGFTYSQVPDSVNHSALAAAVLDAEAEPQDLHAWHGVTPANQSSFRARIIDTLRTELADVDTVVLSNEHLSSRLQTPAQVDALSALLGSLDADVRIVMYLRRPVPFVESSWSMLCKSGATEPFRVEDQLLLPERYDCTAVARRWESAFPGGVRAVAYREEWRTSRTQLPRHFCALVGIAWTDDFRLPDSVVNPSLSAADLELLVQLNRLRSADPSPDLEQVWHDFVLAAERRGTGRPFELTHREAAAVEAAFGGTRIELAGLLPEDDLAYLRASSDRPLDDRSIDDGDRLLSLGTLLGAAEGLVQEQRAQAEAASVGRRAAEDELADTRAILDGMEARRSWRLTEWLRRDAQGLDGT
jgi:hypothetical protein